MAVLFGIGVVLALQASKAAPVLPFIPQIPWPWLMSPESLLPAHKLVTSLLERPHVGLLFAVSGVPVIALGVLCARQHSAALRAEKQRRADQLRRVQDYVLTIAGLIIWMPGASLT